MEGKQYFWCMQTSLRQQYIFFSNRTQEYRPKFQSLLSYRCYAERGNAILCSPYYSWTVGFHLFQHRYPNGWPLWLLDKPSCWRLTSSESQIFLLLLNTAVYWLLACLSFYPMLNNLTRPNPRTRSIEYSEPSCFESPQRQRISRPEVTCGVSHSSAKHIRFLQNLIQPHPLSTKFNWTTSTSYHT